MSRTNAPFLAAIQQPNAIIFPLFELQFQSGTVYWCGLPYDVAWNGHTYLGVGGLVSVSTVTETGGTAQGLQLVIAGMRAADRSLLANEKVQNRKLIYNIAAIDSSNALQVDSNTWSGSMDYMELDATSDAPTLTIYAEHYMILWDRAHVVRYTDSAQKRIDPTDRGLEFVAAVSEADLIWPSKAILIAQG